MIAAIIVLGFLGFVPLIIVVVWHQHIKKIYQKIKPGDIWIDTNDTDPFHTRSLKILDKQIGTDGKTPWVLYEDSFGFRHTIRLRELIPRYKSV